MIKLHTTLVALFFVLFSTSLFAQEKIEFEVSPYNLLFTEVEIGEKSYTALIDFGDFAEMQLSSKLIDELKLETAESEIVTADVNGNMYYLKEGTLPGIKIGGSIEKEVHFYSAENEIDAVSEQVGTDFQLVLGFGYFKDKSFTMNFTKNIISFEITDTDQPAFEANFNADFGYLVVDFETSENEAISLLFDTGSPNSCIDVNKLTKNYEDASVDFQGFSFPGKQIEVQSNDESLVLKMENQDISSLEPLGVIGIFGTNDMLGKTLTYNSLRKTMSIYANSK